MMPEQKAIEEYFADVTGGATAGRVARLQRIMRRLSALELAKLRVEECQDEYTGVRYGNIKCRAGRCEKLGGGGRNRGSRYAYQVWAVWS